MLRDCVLVATLLLSACTKDPARSHDGESTGSAPGFSPVSTQPPVDAAIVVDAVVDAPIACEPGERSPLPLKVGNLTLPDGYCWRRQMEGDDQSGVIYGPGRIPARYWAVAYQKIRDGCEAKRPGVSERVAGKKNGVRYMTCKLEDGRHCLSFFGEANVCTELPEDPSFTLTMVIDGIARR